MLKKIIDNFIKSHGRRPRVLICNFEPTEKSVEYSDLAIQYANSGFDVDLAPCNSELSHIFKQSIENDVHFIHLHLNSYENKKIISELKKKLNQRKKIDILFIVSTENESHEIIKGNILYLSIKNKRLKRSLPKILDALQLK